MFVNFSNHPSKDWCADQLEAAQGFGNVIDMPFPAVVPSGDEAYIEALADEYSKRILGLSPQAVLCQGEFTLAFAVVERLKAAGVRVVAACSRRDVRERKVGNTGEKTLVFRFVRFRDY